jgi:hypothetical protein
MKVRVLAAALLLSPPALAACGSTQQSSGGGGNACASAGSQALCLSCNEQLYPEGATLLNDLLDCLFCTACYTVCQSASQPGLCGDAGAPPTIDACDTGTPSSPGAGTTCGDQNGGCVQCAEQLGATCSTPAYACNQNAQCPAFNAAILQCPTN